jgi:hypothetical protein
MRKVRTKSLLFVGSFFLYLNVTAQESKDYIKTELKYPLHTLLQALRRLAWNR